jgi:hypothetical protein
MSNDFIFLFLFFLLKHKFSTISILCLEHYWTFSVNSEIMFAQGIMEIDWDHIYLFFVLRKSPGKS